MNYFDKARSERAGVSHCEKTISNLGMIFREQPISDFGIDAQIEIYNEIEEYASGKIVALQIKSGASYFSESNNDHVVYRGSNKHYNYWLKHSLPVILILFNPETEECIWEHINPQTAHKTKKGWFVNVPRSKKLAQCKHLIEEIATNQSEYEKRLHTLLLAKPWMQAIGEGNRVILEADEWINKTSGRGSVTLKIESYDGCEHIVINWPFVHFGLENYAEVFAQLFPWADFDVDHELYDDIEQEEYITNNCPYDSEEGVYLFTDSPEFDADFEEHSDSLPRIRPYCIEAGEVASYRLALSLNHIGEMFLELDQFLENGAMYSLDETLLE